MINSDKQTIIKRLDYINIDYPSKLVLAPSFIPTTTDIKIIGFEDKEEEL